MGEFLVKLTKCVRGEIMNIVVSGGGTGGHIYPALALIREIKKETKDTNFLYIGTEKGLESKLVTRENIPFKSIHITGFKRKYLP